MKHLAVGCALLVSGCAGVDYAMKNYGGVPIETFRASTGSQFRIFDKPSEHRMMITPSIAASVRGGAVSGLTFGVANPANVEVVFRDAAEEYLASTGRRCRSRDITKIVDPQYEIRYECEPAEPVAAAIPD